MSGGGKKKGAAATISNYHMSIQFGMCHGPVDSIRKIIIKEKEAWSGVQAHEGEISLDRMDLFGGDEKEGGVRGIVRFMPGDAAQVVPDNLAAKFGRTSATMPAYRKVASVFFYAGDHRGSATPEEPQFSARGFLWTQNNPYLPSTWITATRTAKGLSSALETIQVDGGFPDSNPAHIIYECLTDPDWGMGVSSSSL